MERSDANILSELEHEIRRQVEDGLERLDVDRLVAIAPWSRRQLERRFREQFFTSPSRYFRACQAEVAGKLLRNGEDVLSATMATGFASPGRLHDAMVSRFGLTSGEVRRHGEGVHLDYGFFEMQIGVVLMAATSRGLTALKLCGAFATAAGCAARLEELRAEYPFADLQEAPEKLQSYADQLVAFLELRSPAFSPRLDILRGTTFQRQVWAVLQQIKPGETWTYREIAERIGRPSAVRAVANACGENNLAIAIPCHRAIRSDGTLAGYRWGIEWKKHLLELEAEMDNHRPPEAQREMNLVAV